jgi:hypothetical protein
MFIPENLECVAASLVKWTIFSDNKFIWVHKSKKVMKLDLFFRCSFFSYAVVSGSLIQENLQYSFFSNEMLFPNNHQGVQYLMKSSIVPWKIIFHLEIFVKYWSDREFNKFPVGWWYKNVAPFHLHVIPNFLWSDDFHFVLWVLVRGVRFNVFLEEEDLKWKG